MSAAPFDFDYQTRVPEPPLGRFVELLWYARGTIPYTREKIAPTGSTVAVFVLGDPIIETANDGHAEPLRAERGFIIGPHDRPVINQPTGETYAVGIVSSAVGCEALFGVRPARLRGRVEQLESMWPLATSLRAELASAGDPAQMLTQLEAALISHHDASIPGLSRCERAVAMLTADPTTPIADIASALVVSHGHLDREFARVVGLSPRVLARIGRMRRLLAGIDARLDVDWADLALDLGWFDQAHLIRDFRRHTGVTPSQYIAAQRDTYALEQAGDAAGFVPER